MAEQQGWQAWDPLWASVADSMRAQAAMPLPPLTRKWRLVVRARATAWRLRRTWLNLLFPVAVGALLAAGGLLLVVSWPLTTKQSSLSGVVTAAATATAFSSAIASAMAIPLNAASGIAAGYTAEFLSRRKPWLVGLYLVVQSGCLFVLAAAGPDRDAATASGLLAAASFAMVWMVVRALLSSSDLHDVALRQATFLRRSCLEGVRELRRAARLALPRKLRGQVKLLLPAQARAEVQLFAGMLRQLRAGVRSMTARERPSEAIAFWHGMRESFIEISNELEGQVGPVNGAAEVLMSAIDDLVVAHPSRTQDEIATVAIRSLASVAALDHRHSEYAAVRALLQSKLIRWTEITWDDDAATIPAASVGALGDALSTYVSYGDYPDAERAIHGLLEIATNATETRRIHIALTAFDGFTAVLPTIARVHDVQIRRHLLRKWTKAAIDLTPLRLKELDVYFQRPSEVLLPGIALMGRTGIQEHLWHAAAGASTEGSEPSDVLEAVIEWLERAIPYLAAADVERHRHPVVEGVCVLYCATLVAADQVVEAEQRALLAQRISNAALLCLTTVEDPPVALEDELGEVLWSTLVAAAFLAGDPLTLQQSAAKVLESLGDLTMLGEIGDLYSRSLLEGLLIAAGQDDGEIGSLLDRVRPQDQWDSDWDMHIEGFGRAPSLNRNRVVSPPELVTAINDWACQQFPRFLS